MLSRNKPKERTSSRKVTPPSPTYMSNDQFAAYLADLRNNRIARPGGARPQPDNQRRDSGRMSTSKRSSLGATSVSETSTTSSHQRNNSNDSTNALAPRSRPSLPATMGRPSIAGSVSSRYSTKSSVGRDYYPEKPVAPLKPSDVVPTATYMERGQRWMEKEEVFSLKQAMDDMDLRDNPEAAAEADEEEKRLYGAALDEAAELVWRHQNGVKPPEPGAPYRYKQHLRKNSYAHARTASAGYYGDDIEPTGIRRSMGSRSVSGSSASSNDSGTKRSRVSFGSVTNGTASARGDGSRQSLDSSRGNSIDSERTKSYRGLASGPRPMASATPGHRRRSSLKRNISGEVQKPFSGDQIWEEPEGSTPVKSQAAHAPAPALDATVQPLRLKQKNPVNRVQFAPEVPSSATASTSTETPAKTSVVSKLISKIEIHKNPPSQSRNPQYTTNTPSAVPAAPASSVTTNENGGSDGSKKGPASPRDDVPRKNGVEIRSDDIRQATSMKLKDRSEKLPTPSFVSDSPGRPIVSFDANWKAPDEAATDQKPDQNPNLNSPGKIGGSGGGSRSPFDRRRQAAAASQQQQQQGPVPVPSTLPSRQQQAPPVDAVPALANRQPPAPSPSNRRQPPAIQIDGPIGGGGPVPVPSIAVSEPEPTPPSTRSAGPAPPIPSISVTGSAPSIPTIVLPGDDDDNDNDMANSPSIPVIITPDDVHNAASPAAAPSQSARPLPTPGQGAAPARGARHAFARPRGHWSPAGPPPPQAVGSRATARCHECRFPIEGRFVKLAGSEERFHPQCFSCYSCGTPLEALEISPEPEPARAARLDRIRRRTGGEILAEEPGQTMSEDGDERLRFYCHLDWHELFAPRCKHCTTPIIGEHIVALGGQHFHYGHFFCAECGDPFAEGTTHIEKDGYAWCVACQTKRTEWRAPKCKSCRRAVIGQYVRALGGEWHDGCFRCAACGGGFEDGQIFPRESAADGRMQILCTACRTRELKA